MGLTSVPLWVSLVGLLIHLWGEEALSIVCSDLGKPLYTNRRTLQRESVFGHFFARCSKRPSEKEPEVVKQVWKNKEARVQVSVVREDDVRPAQVGIAGSI